MVMAVFRQIDESSTHIFNNTFKDKMNKRSMDNEQQSIRKNQFGLTNRASWHLHTEYLVSSSASPEMIASNTFHCETNGRIKASTVLAPNFVIPTTAPYQASGPFFDKSKALHKA